MSCFPVVVCVVNAFVCVAINTNIKLALLSQITSCKSPYISGCLSQYTKLEPCECISVKHKATSLENCVQTIFLMKAISCLHSFQLPCLRLKVQYTRTRGRLITRQKCKSEVSPEQVLSSIYKDGTNFLCKSDSVS